MQSIESIVSTYQDRYISDLCEILKIPSVSTDSEFAPEVNRCAEFLAHHMQTIGLEHVQVLPTKGYPVVYGDYLHQPGKPTILIYGHYDVQPADPLHLWHSPPFEPTIKDGQIYARGVSDDKGQFYCHLKAVESYIRAGLEVPVNVKFLIEGEEENGSPSLASFIMANQALLKADGLLISDNTMFDADTPSVCYSLRGLCYMEVIVKGSNTDLHSGQHGGPAPNPIQALSAMITRLKNEKGRVLIPGFYDAVDPIPDPVREQIRMLRFNDHQYAMELGVESLWGEEGFSPLEQRWFRPTLDCNGIVGGYIGQGSKTIIPAEARAKISMRLVSRQDPDQIFELAMAYLTQIKPSGVTLDFIRHHGGKPVLCNLDASIMKAGIRAVKTVTGKTPVFQGEGGSIPIVDELKKSLGVECLLLGFNLPDDKVHAPNERFGIINYIQGIKISAQFLAEYANI